VHPHYRNYEEINLETSDVEMKEVADADDFLEHEVSFSSKSQKFSYGASPGFKFKG
jgi:hypothetical protein